MCNYVVTSIMSVGNKILTTVCACTINALQRKDLKFCFSVYPPPPPSPPAAFMPRSANVKDDAAGDDADVPYMRCCLKNNRIHARYYRPGCNKNSEH